MSWWDDVVKKVVTTYEEDLQIVKREKLLTGVDGRLDVWLDGPGDQYN